MSQSATVRDRIVEPGVVAVLRGIDEAQIVPAARAIAEGGVVGIEITVDGTRAFEKIAAVDRDLADTDAVVGAGTVLDATAARASIDAGARFVVSPGTNPDVLAVCNRQNVLSAPGVLTPTEAITAMEAGADILKLFPASTVGPGHIGALRGPLGDVDVIPTGGISTENAADYLDAGAVAVGAGSALVDYDAIEAGDWDAVRASAAAFVDAVATAQSD